MTTRSSPVVDFAVRPPPGDLRRVVDTLGAVLGKVTALVDVLLLFATGGYTVTNAAASPGTSLAFTRTWLDCADAGANQARVVARGNAGAVGTVYVTVYDRTNSAELARVAVVDGADQTVAGAWTTFTPSGSDQEVEIRVIADGVLDPVLTRVSLQLRTVKAQT